MEKDQNTVKKYPKETISKSLFDLKNNISEEIGVTSLVKPKINTLMDEK